MDLRNFESSNGLMFFVPIGTGLLLILLYRLIYTRVQLHGDLSRVYEDLASISGLRVFHRVVVNVFSLTMNRWISTWM